MVNYSEEPGENEGPTAQFNSEIARIYGIEVPKG
jgi:hypothetical protein